MVAMSAIRSNKFLGVNWNKWYAQSANLSQVFIFLFAISICGLLFGGLVAGQLSPGESKILSGAVANLLQSIIHHDLAPSAALWWQRMVHDGQLLLLLWLFGVSVIGVPLVIVVLFLRAFSVGFAIGFTVLQFGWKGLLISLVTIFPHQLLALSVFLVVGVCAIRFSTGILRQSYPFQQLSKLFIRYSAIFVAAGLFLAIAAALEAYVSPYLLYSLFYHA